MRGVVADMIVEGEEGGGGEDLSFRVWVLIYRFRELSFCCIFGIDINILAEQISDGQIWALLSSNSKRLSYIATLLDGCAEYIGR